MYICVLCKIAQGGNPRTVSVRLVGNYLPTPAISDFTWKAWLNDKETTFLVTGDEAYFIPYTGTNPSGYGWEYALILNLAKFPSWTGKDVLHIKVNLKGMAGTEWEETIGFNANVSLGYVEDPSKFIAFEKTNPELKVVGDTICSGEGEGFFNVSLKDAPTEFKINWTKSDWSLLTTTTGNNTNMSFIEKIPIVGFSEGDYVLHAILFDGSTPLDTADFDFKVNVSPEATLTIVDKCYPPKLKATVIAKNNVNYNWGILSPIGAIIKNGISPDECEVNWTKSNGAIGTLTSYVIVTDQKTLCTDSIIVSGQYVKLDLQVAWKSLKDTCINFKGNLELSCSTASPGNYTLNYEYISSGNTEGISKQALISLPPKSGTVPSIEVNDVGTYILKSIYNKAYTACAVEVEEEKSTIKVGEKPVVNLNKKCLALNKDSLSLLNVVNNLNYSYLWDVNVYDMSSNAWISGGISNGNTDPSMNIIMSDKDMRYIVTVTDQSDVLSCKASDTAYIYNIPESPLLSLSKTDDDKLKLDWSAVGATEFSVWSRKWDPYCLKGGSYEEIITPNLTWTEDAMDTLEFYYVTANRNVCGQTYYSKTTDTVGYFIQNIVYDPNIAGLNYISYPFDMSSYMGGGQASNLISTVIKDDRIQLSEFGFNEQLWNPCFYLFGSWMGDFTLEVGRSYLIDVIQDYSVFMYGKLPNKVSYHFDSGVNGNLASGLLPFHHANMNETVDILMDLNEKILVYYWNFDAQIFDATLIMFGSPMGSVPIKACYPLLCEPNGVTSINWN